MPLCSWKLKKKPESLQISQVNKKDENEMKIAAAIS